MLTAYRLPIDMPCKPTWHETPASGGREKQHGTLPLASAAASGHGRSEGDHVRDNTCLNKQSISKKYNSH